jgi:hypothetical protein
MVPGWGRKYEDMAGTGKTATQSGIGLGSAIAVTISWRLNHSILWAIVHGLLNWIYVIYYALGYGRG